ncbi:MAG: hypothetical protein HOI59_11015 [Nitrospina sp.]|nr:hypothetical protein [Nitrospina sp.]MBT3856326.1 hypothetical protein [Nitrospina sp.]MBT4105630.1 hypothetical protein [Nitrospina sp.]MBT4390282.1 hypothetical protein [Nitrospina sp.]MBT4620538.1 hypothetical protein [Nitrospina sp.]
MKNHSIRHRESRSGVATQVFWIASSPLVPRNDGLCRGLLAWEIGNNGSLSRENVC